MAGKAQGLERVIRVVLAVRRTLPVFPEQRTISVQAVYVRRRSQAGPTSSYPTEDRSGLMDGSGRLTGARFSEGHKVRTVGVSVHQLCVQQNGCPALIL